MKMSKIGVKVLILSFITFNSNLYAQEQKKEVIKKEVVKKESTSKKKDLQKKTKKVVKKTKSNVKEKKINLTKDQLEALKKFRRRQAAANAKKSKVGTKGEKTVKRKKNSKAIYQPAPVHKKTGYVGYNIKRGSTSIIEDFMNVGDEMQVKMCIFSGTDFILEGNQKIQRVVLDDQIFFASQTLNNNKAVHVQMIQPLLKDEGYIETSLRIYREKDDIPYIVNLVGVPCPEKGLVKFPKVVRIKERHGGINPGTRVLPPEDFIIEESYGFKPKYQTKLKVYDMVVDSDSDYVSLGVELQFPKNKKFNNGMAPAEFKVLDALQINKMKTIVEYLPIPSKKASEKYGKPTYRFNLKVKMDKKYIMTRRYIHLMYIDEGSKTYQYFRLNSMLWMSKAKERGMHY